jgi:4-amino-4-deoxy-L-arabinose transferase-like glycosyltransferase
LVKNSKVIVFAALLLLAIVSVYLFSASRTTLWDRDEPRFARASVEMIKSGNYLIPTFNGELWLDKPILTYWFQASAIKIFGQTEFACRFFSAIGTAICCFFVFIIGKRLSNAKEAFWAIAIVSTTMMMFAIGTLATSDGVTIPFTAGAMLIFTYAITSKPKFYHAILIGIALGFGMLAKGPIGLLPVPAIGAALFLNRKNSSLSKNILFGIMALIIGGLIFMLWAIPANKAANGEFFKVFIGRHVIERALRPMEHHGGNFFAYLPYYIPVVIGGFFPWILFLPGAFSAMLGKRIGTQESRILLISWIVPVFIIMSLAITKLPHYIIFIWPALALSAAAVICAAEENKLADVDKMWMRRGVWFFLPIAGGLMSVLMAAPWILKIPALRIPGMIAGMILFILSILVYRFQQANRFKESAKTVLAGIILFDILLAAGVIPAFEQIKITPYISEQIRTKTSEDVPVAMYKFAEPTLNFYVNRKIERIKDENRVVEWIRQTGAGVLIVPADVIADIQKRYGVTSLEQIASRKGYNYSKGKEVEITVLLRKGDIVYDRK